VTRPRLEKGAALVEEATEVRRGAEGCQTARGAVPLLIAASWPSVVIRSGVTAVTGHADRLQHNHSPKSLPKIYLPALCASSLGFTIFTLSVEAISYRAMHIIALAYFTGNHACRAIYGNREPPFVPVAARHSRSGYACLSRAHLYR
jgi:hypothetical protein